LRIFLMSSHTPLCHALRQTLALEPEFHIVGEATAAQDCAARVDKARPDVVLLDWDLPGMQAMTVLRALQLVDFRPKVVVFSQCNAVHQEVLDAGAVAFVCREDPVKQLLDILLNVGGLSPCLLG
jgi:DNA-binding NarL/FixJ family response regulator